MIRFSLSCYTVPFLFCHNCLIHNSYTHCLVLVGSRYGFERDFTIELKSIEGIVEDRLICQISPLVKIVKTKKQNSIKLPLLLCNLTRLFISIQVFGTTFTCMFARSIVFRPISDASLNKSVFHFF